jgi:hypothetical protein
MKNFKIDRLLILGLVLLVYLSIGWMFFGWWGVLGFALFLIALPFALEKGAELLDLWYLPEQERAEVADKKIAHVKLGVTDSYGVRWDYNQQFSLWKITLPYGGLNHLKHRELVWVSPTEDLTS